MIQFKPLRYLGIALLLLGIFGTGLYGLYVTYSGTVVAEAKVASSTQQSDESIQRYFSEYQYYNVIFEPVTLTPEMGELKVILKVYGSLSPSQKQLQMATRDTRLKKANLKAPAFQLRDSENGETVLTTSFEADWSRSKKSFSEQISSVGSVSSKEGSKVEGTRHYNLGRFTPPREGKYTLSGDSILMQKLLGIDIKSAKNFSYELRAGAVDFDLRIALWLIGSIVAGVVICLLTRPPGLTNVSMRRRK